MYGEGFDAVTRMLCRRRGRRPVLGALLGLGAGVPAVGDASARRICRGASASCTRDAQCCSGVCARGAGEPRHRRNRCLCAAGEAWCDGRCTPVGATCASGATCTAAGCRCPGSDVPCAGEGYACSDGVCRFVPCLAFQYSCNLSVEGEVTGGAYGPQRGGGDAPMVCHSSSACANGPGCPPAGDCRCMAAIYTDHGTTVETFGAVGGEGVCRARENE